MTLTEKLDYFFENHPAINVVYTTSDDTLFIQKSYAQTHAQTLDDKEVKENNRPKNSHTEHGAKKRKK